MTLTLANASEVKLLMFPPDLFSASAVQDDLLCAEVYLV
jgi:hypothetical protein